MEHLGPHRQFRSPHDMRGVPTVSRRRPIPVRETPLPGTKVMLTPPDESLFERLGSGSKVAAFSEGRLGRFAGGLALALAVLFAFWALLRPFFEERSGGFDWSGVLIMFAFGAVHVLAIISQMASGSRNLPGALAVPALYLSIFVSLVIDHLMH